MKKYIFALSLAAITLASCTVKEEVQPVVSGSQLTLTGSSYAATRVSIGEKDGDTYPLLWYTGDVISVNSTDGEIDGEKANLYSGSSGKAEGVFQTVNDVNVTSDKSLVILYPGNSLTYADGVIEGSVPTTQTQRSADSSVHVGNNCFSYATATLSAGQTEGLTFALKQKTAFVKIEIAPIEGYSQYYLSGVTLSADGYELSGDVSYDISSDELTVTDASSSVGVTISNPTAFTSTQTVYFTALPCDLTGKEVSVTLTLSGDGTETVTLPSSVSGGQLKESCLSLITMGEVSVVNWYDPVETRDLVENGWAYGKQNTYLIEQYEGATNHLNIDVRARGDYSKVTKPAYYGLLTGSAETADGKFCYLPNNVDTYEETPTNKVNDDCTIDVYCYSQADGDGSWAVVGLYDEDYNIIWSFMIWKYLSGDEPQDVTYMSDMVLIDRPIGIPCGQAAGLANGTYAAPGSSVAYFQFGRKDPFPWNQITTYGVAAAGNNIDFTDGIKNPTTMYYCGDNDSGWAWPNAYVNFWGGVNETSGDYDTEHHSIKTIYDPCPAGYRVPDPYVMYYLWDNGEMWEKDNNNPEQPEDCINPDSPFYSTESVFAYKLPNGTYDYWPYTGILWGSSASYTNRSNLCMGYWAASLHSTWNPHIYADCIHIIYYSSGGPSYARWGRKRAGFAVRCQKDDENR